MPLTISNTVPNGLLSKLPSMAQYNANFKQQNPQYFTPAPSTVAASPQPALGGKTATNAQAAQLAGGTPQYTGGAVSQVPAPTPTMPATPFSGIGLYQGVLNQLTNPQSTQNLQQQAENIANTAGQKISDIGQLGARGAAGYDTTGTSPVGEGNAAVLNQSTAAQQNAVAQGANTQLSGIDKALTGQGLIQSALTSAGGLAAPTNVPYGTQFGSPSDIATGLQNGTGGGGALNPINNVSSIAQQVVSGQISPSQAYAMGGSVANWQGLLNQAIQQAKPGFNTAQAEGQYAANQQNTTTSGTAQTNAAAGAYSSLYPQTLQLQNTVQNVDQLGTLLLGTMIDQNGNTINPSDAKYANTVLANIRSQLSTPQQATFDTTFAQLRAQIAALLSAGGAQIPTQVTADANSIIDGSLPLGSLNAVLQRISTEGSILQQNQQNQQNTAAGVIGAPKVGSGNNPLNI